MQTIFNFSSYEVNSNVIKVENLDEERKKEFNEMIKRISKAHIYSKILIPDIIYTYIKHHVDLKLPNYKPNIFNNYSNDEKRFNDIVILINDECIYRDNLLSYFKNNKISAFAIKDNLTIDELCHI